MTRLQTSFGTSKSIRAYPQKSKRKSALWANTLTQGASGSFDLHQLPLAAGCFSRHQNATGSASELDLGQWRRALSCHAAGSSRL